MNLYYWTDFYKKRNSTRQPASAGTCATVKLKEPTSFWRPVIDASGITKNANYFKIPAGIFITTYDAYYFVTDVISLSDGITRFSLELDVLATYKTLIGTSYLYVARQSDATKFNPQLTDPLNPMTTEVTISSATSPIQFTYASQDLDLFDLTAWRFILTAVGANAYTSYDLNNGLSKTYVLSGTTMREINLVLNDNNFLENLVKELTNPMESILSCKVMPMSMVGQVDTNNFEPIFFGSHSTGITSRLLINRVRNFDVTLSLPSILSGAQTYMTKSPFVTATIYLPFVGVCPLDVDQIAGKNLKLRVIADCFTGDLIYQIIELGSQAVVQSFTGNCATDCPIATSNYNALGIASGVLTTIGGVASSNPMMTAAGVLSSVTSLESHTQVNGQHSCAIGGWGGIHAVVTAYQRGAAHSIADNAATEGLPYEKVVQINTLSGYIQCRNASVEIPGSVRDKEAVNDFLNGGFFYE